MVYMLNKKRVGNNEQGQFFDKNGLINDVFIKEQGQRKYTVNVHTLEKLKEIKKK